MKIKTAFQAAFEAGSNHANEMIEGPDFDEWWRQNGVVTVVEIAQSIGHQSAIVLDTTQILEILRMVNSLTIDHGSPVSQTTRDIVKTLTDAI